MVMVMLVVALNASGWQQQHYYGLNNNVSIVITGSSRSYRGV